MPDPKEKKFHSKKLTLDDQGRTISSNTQVRRLQSVNLQKDASVSSDSNTGCNNTSGCGETSNSYCTNRSGCAGSNNVGCGNWNGCVVQ